MEALALAEAHLPWGVTRLACVNNYAVLLVEGFRGRRREGITMAREALDQACHKAEKHSEEMDSLLEIVHGNIRQWSEEESDHETTRRAFDDSVVDYRDLWGIPPRQPWVRHRNHNVHGTRS